MRRYSRMLRTFVSGGSLGLVRLATGLIRIKYIAVALGVSGVGLVAQANQFYLLSVSLMTLSMAVGVINLTRDKAALNNDERRRRVQSTALTSVLALSALYLGLALYFSDEIRLMVFDRNLPEFYFHVLIYGLPFTAVASGYIEGIFFARDRYDLYVKASAIASAFELLAFVFLTFHYGLQGTFMAIGMTGPILFMSFFFFLKKLNEPFGELFTIRFHRAEFFKIMKFCGIVISSSALGYFVTLWARALIIKDLGAEVNGLMQPAIALSAYALPFITNGVWGHLHPLASRSGNSPAAKSELRQVLMLVTSLSAICSLSFITFADLLIPLIYSRQFLLGADAFSYQFAGDFFYYIFFTVNVYLLAISRLKYYLFNWCLYYGGLLLMVSYLAKDLGVRSYGVSHLAVSFVLFVINSFWLMRSAVFEKRLALHYLILLVAVGLAAAFRIYQTSFWLIVPVWAAGVGFAVYSPKKEGL